MRYYCEITELTGDISPLTALSLILRVIIHYTALSLTMLVMTHYSLLDTAESLNLLVIRHYDSDFTLLLGIDLVNLKLHNCLILFQTDRVKNVYLFLRPSKKQGVPWLESGKLNSLIKIPKPPNP